jgi:hypothetical protein
VPPARAESQQKTILDQGVSRMAGGFDKREKGFESKWAHDEELRFKVYARRNKLLGVWAAGELGLLGASAEAYAREVVAADFEKPGDDDVFEKLRRDLDGKKISLSDHLLRRKMEELLEEAKRQIEAEAKK